ncbi:MAG: T9SS type A sorting domain-containing protein [Bacteroidetes bacterium]|nr:T9SS type A sorting domain-containing protein [Bacteroidota bacterium]
MKKISTLLLFLAVLSLTQSAFAQVYPFNDDFENATAFQTPAGYSGDITVYLVHGTGSSKGPTAFMNNFNAKDSLETPLIGTLNSNSGLSFDWRIISSTLYPSTTISLVAGEEFSVLVSANGGNYVSVFTVNASNYTPTLDFAHVNIPLGSFSGSNITLKFLAKRSASNPDEYFADFDNLSVSDTSGTSGISSNGAPRGIELYPNPARDRVTVTWPGNSGAQISMYNILGKSVMERNFETGYSAELDISNMPQGVYYLKILSGEIHRTLRFKKD